jgi:hypothetical protein
MTSDEGNGSSKTIKINYLKTNDFREVACDGVLGGPTPQGKVWLAFYTERFPIPKIVEHSLLEKGQEGQFSIEGDPVVIDTREGILRNMEFGVYMSFAAAEQLRDWITLQLAKKPDGLK